MKHFMTLSLATLIMSLLLLNVIVKINYNALALRNLVIKLAAVRICKIYYLNARYLLQNKLLSTVDNLLLKHAIFYKTNRDDIINTLNKLLNTYNVSISFKEGNYIIIGKILNIKTREREGYISIIARTRISVVNSKIGAGYEKYDVLEVVHPLRLFYFLEVIKKLKDEVNSTNFHNITLSQAFSLIRIRLRELIPKYCYTRCVFLVRKLNNTVTIYLKEVKFIDYSFNNSIFRAKTVSFSVMLPLLKIFSICKNKNLNQELLIKLTLKR